MTFDRRSSAPLPRFQSVTWQGVGLVRSGCGVNTGRHGADERAVPDDTPVPTAWIKEAR